MAATVSFSGRTMSLVLAPTEAMLVAFGSSAARPDDTNTKIATTNAIDNTPVIRAIDILHLLLCDYERKQPSGFYRKGTPGSRQISKADG